MTLFTRIGHIDLVVFDLDGTLVDTKSDIIKAFEWTLAQNNVEPVDPKDIEALVGTGVEGYLRQCLASNIENDPEDGIKQFRSYYRSNFSKKSSLFPHIQQILEFGSTVPMVVLSNKSEIFAKPLLERLGIARYFSGIYAAEAFEKRKPDALPLQRICEIFGISPDRTLIIGDSPHDINCGRSAGAKTCAAAYGYAPKGILEGCGADWLVQSPQDLIGLFKTGTPNLAHRLASVISKPSRRIIGLMSGMSMDGVDLACADIGGNFPDLSVKLVSSHFMPYSDKLRHQLLVSGSAGAGEISELNVLVAKAFASCVEQFFQIKGIDRVSIDAIGSHGQTLFHSTQADVERSTLQVGSPSIIAELSALITIGNFRVRDVARGGQGAPLVAIADYILFREKDRAVALHNLGSISNITVVTPQLEGLMSFDSGPANMAIDYYARMAPNNPDGIDGRGELSQKGSCIPELLEKWMNSPYFEMAPPKAAGYADFGIFRVQDQRHSIEDHIRTAVEYAARTIQSAYRRFVLPRYPDLKKVSFSGGGIYNLTLMSRIRELLPELNIEILENEFSDAKEALAFAILANETLSGRPGSFPTTTGVENPTVLGEIAL